VLCITGNGLKTTDVLAGAYEASEAIPPKYAAFEQYLQQRLEIPAGVEA
jgi:threonine synthase